MARREIGEFITYLAAECNIVTSTQNRSERSILLPDRTDVGDRHR
nr:hypothetical protein [Chamaesiphon sp. VAR_69_metabat_338]